MGYYERRIGGALLGGMAIVCVLSLVAIGPWMIGNAMAGPSLGWAFEIIYIIGAILIIERTVRKQRQRAAALAQHRMAMVMTNQVWFDPELRHFRHSTCTVRHRSPGAAQR